MPDVEILIVGGGPAGLTTAGALKQIGLEAIILDAGERIGQSWDQRYQRLHLHTVREYSGLAHFPIPRSYPKYLSKDQYADYLCDYVSYFRLNFIPNTRVRRVRQQAGEGRSIWAVDTGEETWTARVVVIAAGQNGQPVVPDWPGFEQYRGMTLHSADYRRGRAFQNQRVLVVGAGNSGAEIAADLAEQGAARVTLSIRTAPPVVPRDFLGTPAQLFGIWMYNLPAALSDRIGSMVSRLAFGDLARFGLPARRWQPFSARRTPVIDVGFVAALKAGKVAIRPGIAAFTSNGVIFQDQRQEEFDAVIFATGFRSGLAELLEPEGLLDERGLPRFPSGATTACQGLYFMGYCDSLRGLLYESNLASRRLARAIKTYLTSVRDNVPFRPSPGPALRAPLGGVGGGRGAGGG
jgi:putative flavoprotein involved in K+ transport